MTGAARGGADAQGSEFFEDLDLLVDAPRLEQVLHDEEAVQESATRTHNRKPEEDHVGSGGCQARHHKDDGDDVAEDPGRSQSEGFRQVVLPILAQFLQVNDLNRRHIRGHGISFRVAGWNATSQSLIFLKLCQS